MTKLAKEVLLKPEQVAKLKELFPQAVVDGKVDFVILKALLGEQVEENNEKYQFTWNGKQNAIAHAQKPSLGTLREDKASSKNFDSTDNLYIEGDNLEVLKLLQKTYQGKIKMIYIDPPYNTGNDFVYKDDFKDNVKNYLELTNQKNKSNAETSGRYHTDWLNMMYPRLMLARNLLTEDGVIFISIDDNEQANLKKICDEIFGEDNLIGTFKWNRTAKAPSLSSTIRTKYEYIHSYKHKNNLKLKGKDSYNKFAPLLHLPNKQKQLIFPKNSIKLNKTFSPGNYSEKYKVELFNNILLNDEGKNNSEVIIKACFAWNQDKVDSYVNNGGIFLVKKDLSTIYYELDNEDGFIPPSDLISFEECGVLRNTDAKNEMRDLNIHFDYSKPISLLTYLLTISTYDSKEALILDFFSGSGTTAHAVMKLNSEDNGNRKFIMVQLPEKTEEDSEAYKAGYKNICEIGKERIRRAGEKVKQEIFENDSSVDVSKLDIGFKVFKLDSTNIKPWDGTQDIEQSLLEASGNVVKQDRRDLDVVHELMLMYGVFHEKIQEIKINEKTLYSIGNHFLVVCLFNTITKQDIEAIIKLKPKNVIFNDAGFKDDNVKINAELSLKNNGAEDIKSL
jgi:adenine-specific DNA-methyltransferase